MPWEHRARPEAQPRLEQPTPRPTRDRLVVVDPELQAKLDRQFVEQCRRDAERHLLKSHQPARYAGAAGDIGLCAACNSSIEPGQRIVNFILAGQTSSVHQGCATAYHSKRLGLTR